MSAVVNPELNLEVARETLGSPVSQGLYDPRFEHDACGVGFVAHVKTLRDRRP